jgi:FMN-dependent NADH-azoreductase
MLNTLLQIDSSARTGSSLSREVTAYLARQLAQGDNDRIIHRDLATSTLPLITEAHIGAYYTRAEERNQEQQQLLNISDELIAELKAEDQLIIGAPMYNFSVTASLKAWIDLVCRVGETFQYGSNGPEGLLNIKRAFIVVAAGGTAIGSDADFVSPFLQQICRFIGINEVHIIDVSGSKRDPDTLIDVAKQQVNDILANIE